MIEQPDIACWWYHSIDVQNGTPEDNKRALRDALDSGAFDGVMLACHYDGFNAGLRDTLYSMIVAHKHQHRNFRVVPCWDMWPAPLRRDPSLDPSYWRERLDWIHAPAPAGGRFPFADGVGVDLEGYCPSPWRETIRNKSPEDFQCVRELVLGLGDNVTLDMAYPCTHGDPRAIYNAIGTSLARVSFTEQTYYHKPPRPPSYPTDYPFTGAGYFVWPANNGQFWTWPDLMRVMPWKVYLNPVTDIFVYPGAHNWLVARHIRASHPRCGTGYQPVDRRAAARDPEP